jgi:hypothetical protein
MRLIAFAAILFAVGFGIVAIGQDALGFSHAGRIVERPDGAPRAKESSSQTAIKTFTDYLVEAEYAFAKMDRTCSAGDRKAFGRAFHQLLAATRALRSGRIEAGDLDRVAARRIEEARPNALLVDFALTSGLPVFAQVFDANRRGILTAADLPPGMIVLMDAQLDSARSAASRDIDPLAAMTVERPSRCMPMRHAAN